MQNKNLYGTTVKGNPDKVEAVKKMGHGKLSEAFRIGCDVLLGITTNDIERLQIQKTRLIHERDIIESKISNTSTKIDEMLATRDENVQLTMFDDKYIIDEYIRCASDIIYSNKIYLVEYLASLSESTTAKDVRGFFKNHTVEPTRREIGTFITG
jgi:hypothetical protein